MTLTAVDERDLLVPLATGMHERPVWDIFLRRLLARTQARQVCLLLRPREAAHLPPVLRRASLAPDDPVPDFAQFDALGLIPLATMRPGRVYALQENLSASEDGLRGRQVSVLAQAQVGQARFIRIRTRAENEGWLAITHPRQDFGGADSALLSSLVPHLGAALDNLAAYDALRLRAVVAEEALAALGIRQAALDDHARTVAADGLAPELPGGRLPLPPRAVQALAKACTALAGAPPGERRIVRASEEDGGDVLLRPCPPADTGLPTAAVAVGLGRTDRRENAASGARVLAAVLGLSPREAALAEAISRGQSIVEAGAALHLTPETARNYTKRIYAKTGASGQADLVRLVLSGLAPLA